MSYPKYSWGQILQVIQIVQFIVGKEWCIGFGICFVSNTIENLDYKDI